MRAVVQHVKEASVTVNNEIYSKIEHGLLVLLGISKDDAKNDMDYIIDKILGLRIFKDTEGKLNEDIRYADGELLIVSQFTLYGDARKGRRPSYSNAAGQENARILYNDFIEKIKAKYDSSKVFTGKFQAMMDVKLINEGPVTILLDSERMF